MARVMDAGDVDRAIRRIAHEVLEKNRGSDDLVLLGIQTRGVPLAKRLALALEAIEGSAVPAGSLDIGLYRDDLDQRPRTELGATAVPVPIGGKTVILVDDVLYTGRTIRAALDALADIGRPSRCPACCSRRPWTPRASHSTGLHREERADVARRTRFRSTRREGRRRRSRHRVEGTDMNHFLTIEGLTADDLNGLLDDADEFVEVLHRPIPKVPALRGKTVATMFFEPSTRTKMSFEKAAKALSADTMSFAPGTSSLSKGESLKDTVLTVKAMGTDAMVVRHKATGAPWRIAEWIQQPVLNAGDGAHQHPTQALLDALTIRQHFGTLNGLKIGIVGDIRHSRVARSDIQAFATLGAEVTMVAPRTLLPVDSLDFRAAETEDLDEVLADFHVVYVLRVQAERGGASVFPSLSEYTGRYGITKGRFARLKPEAIVLHPGPMNRGVEIEGAVADDPRALILDQVFNGVAVRMAVLFRLLGGEHHG